jgi:hypothetical protein
MQMTRYLTTTALILALAMPATAGGPVIVEEAYEAEATKPKNGWIVPVIIGGIVLCALACGGGGDDAPPVAPPPGPVCKTGC